MNAIDALTSGVITATVSEGDLATLATLTGTHAYTITVTDMATGEDIALVLARILLQEVPGDERWDAVRDRIARAAASAATDGGEYAALDTGVLP